MQMFSYNRGPCNLIITQFFADIKYILKGIFAAINIFWTGNIGHATYGVEIKKVQSKEILGNAGKKPHVIAFDSLKKSCMSL